MNRVLCGLLLLVGLLAAVGCQRNYRPLHEIVVWTEQPSFPDALQQTPGRVHVEYRLRLEGRE